MLPLLERNLICVVHAHNEGDSKNACIYSDAERNTCDYVMLWQYGVKHCVLYPYGFTILSEIYMYAEITKQNKIIVSKCYPI